MTQLIDLDATEIISSLKNGKTTSEKVVQAHIKQINQVNPSLNAMTEDRFSTALTEADQVDKSATMDFDQFPLLGVPISIKEAFYVKNMKTTGGLPNRQDIISSEDAPTIKKLK